MKTTLAVALALFTFYLAGCDFIGSVPEAPPSQEVDEVPVEDPADWGPTAPFYAPMSDTAGRGGS